MFFSAFVSIKRVAICRISSKCGGIIIYVLLSIYIMKALKVVIFGPHGSGAKKVALLFGIFNGNDPIESQLLVHDTVAEVTLLG